MKPALVGEISFVEMFFEEARVGTQLQARDIAQVYDFVEEGGNFYLVMEWVEGIDLATYAQFTARAGHSTRWELVTAVGVGLLRGLSAAHERVTESGQVESILHRDVSPHNILISNTGSAKLIDFGLSLAKDRLSAPTPIGVAKGKIAYLAPEVAQGARPTPAADQFAAGIVLWQTLAGRKLFVGETPEEVLRAVVEAKVEPLSKLRPDIPRALSRAIHRSLHKNPEKRFGSTREMANAMGAVLKQAEKNVDVYQLLASTVQTVREGLQMGRRTQAPDLAESSIEEEQEVAVELSTAAMSWLRAKLPFLQSGRTE